MIIVGKHTNRKASLNLFFKEQMERYYETLDKQISDNKEISRTINDIKELEYKIEELEIEIEKSPNTESILQIIEEARKHRKTSIEIKTPFDNFIEIIIKLLRIKR
jgi:CHASE3 domain sensor protein